MSSAEDVPVVNTEVLSTLLESIGGERELLEDLAAEFLADLDGLVGDMETSLAEGDMTSFGRAAHSMKSTSASFGAMRLSGLARVLEDESKAGTLSDGAGMMGAVKVEARDVGEHLPNAIAEIEASG